MTAHRGSGRKVARTTLLIGLAVAAIASPLFAQGDPGPQVAPSAAPASVNLNPKRITFDRTGKSATISVSSAGGAGAFDVELIDRVMLPDGQIVPAATPSASAQAA